MAKTPGALEETVEVTSARRRQLAGLSLDAFVEDPRIRRGFTYAAIALYFFLIQQYFWPAPLGVLLQGVVIGGLTALIAFGIALIYRANRIVNFAAGDHGAVPASLAVLLIVGPNLPYFLALPIGMGAALVLGAVVEFLIIRRFFTAPRLILTVVTIGLGLLLGALGTVLPLAFDINTPPQSFPSPFDFHFGVGQTIFYGNHVLAMVAVPVVILGIAAFFRYTRVGIAVRASAENADRAFLLGIPVKRIETVVWVIATLMSALAVFLRAGIVGLPIGRVLGPSILVRALAAVVMARMERLPTIFGASALLGILESSLIFQGEATLVDPIMFVVILATLLVQRRGHVARADEQSAWQAAAEIRPIPRELVRLPEVVWGKRGAYALLALVALGFPFVTSDSQVSLAGAILISAMVGISLVVLTGWAGQVSLGQVAFMGIGAATAGWLTAIRNMDLSVSLLAAGLVGAAAAMIIGLPALRIRGLLLAVVTLSFALATHSYVLNPGYQEWLPNERFERPLLFDRIAVDTEDRYYFFILACLAAVAFAVRGIRKSRTGRVMIGVRENERGAQAYGVSAIRAKLTAFAVSGFIAAFAGGIFVHHQQVLGIQPYGPEQSFEVFLFTVVGGIGSVAGAIIGAVFVEGFQYFRSIFPDAIENLIGFIAGPVGVIFVLMVLKGGLAQAFFGFRDSLLRKVAERHDILVPSLVADRRVTEELEAGVFDTSADATKQSNGRKRRAQKKAVAESDQTMPIPAPEGAS